MSEENKPAPNFIRNIIKEDNASGKWDGRVCTRFPPEPNGYLHIGHAKSICLNYALAQENNGVFHLRFDDTNPEKESDEYVESIKKDVSWLGADWGDNLFFASSYFDQLYEWAVQLIKNGKAFVCDLNAEEMREYRGDLKNPGKNSPFRDRSVEENLDLFERMKNGEFADGEKALRAKIDMSSPNMNMRDPVLYRIRKVHHHRTGDKWCIYPMYDFTHPLSDSIEKITHSICTLEFEDHRPLYDWACESLGVYHPQQIEFARLNLDYTIMSKRYLLQLVEEKLVSGWDDPRMPTVSGMRRRGYTPESIRNFCEQIGVTKKNSSISIGTLEGNVRDDLNTKCERRFAVIDPLKVTITNWKGPEQEIEVENHPLDESRGKRKITFGPELYIEKDDFMEDAPKKYFRLAPGKNVRLKFGYILTYEDHVKDDAGNVIEVKCTYEKDSLGGVTPEGVKKPKGIINWVSAANASDVEVRLYDRLITVPKPNKENFKKDLNPDSLQVVKAKVEKSVLSSKVGDTFQFERQGYFRADEDSQDGVPVFNRVVTLKDTWFKIEKQHAQA